MSNYRLTKSISQRKQYRWFPALLTVCLLWSGIGTAVLPTAAESAESEDAEETLFAFEDSMSKETLRAYCSRAVSLAGFCVENNTADPCFEDDLRMLLRIGAKFVGRAAYYSWGGDMSLSQIEKHYETAAQYATLAHDADPEMILQAGVFEIIYRGTANATPIPDYVFEAFGLPAENRNFRFEDMVFTEGTYALSGNYWGTGAGVPDITKTETQMYFYWQITRYIDAGFEAIHLGQAELMANYDQSRYKHWDKVTTLARAYAADNARRGIVLFDCHTNIASGGMKVGNRLICDIIGAGLVPNETVEADGAYQCRISHYKDCWLQWIGRSAGGQHPLGFTVDQCFTILEFDNYGGNGNPGVATVDGFYNWGWDDITWFALQPEWYRNQFLAECNTFLTQNVLDAEGKQQYFLQPACRRVITGTTTLTYTVTDESQLKTVKNILRAENALTKWDGLTATITVRSQYRANNPSDACPLGFGQEDAIRAVFLGEDAPDTAVYTAYMQKKAVQETPTPDATVTEKPSEEPSEEPTETPTETPAPSPTTEPTPTAHKGLLPAVGIGLGVLGLGAAIIAVWAKKRKRP